MIKTFLLFAPVLLPSFEIVTPKVARPVWEPASAQLSAVACMAVCCMGILRVASPLLKPRSEVKKYRSKIFHEVC